MEKKIQKSVEKKPQSNAKFHYSVNIYSAKTGSDEHPEHIMCEEYNTIEDARTRLHQLYKRNAIDNDPANVITATFENDNATIVYTEGYTSFYTIEQFQKVNKYDETI